MTANHTSANVIPWGYALFKHMHDTHGLVLTLSELEEIVLIARSLDREPPRCETCEYKRVSLYADDQHIYFTGCGKTVFDKNPVVCVCGRAVSLCSTSASG